jgi:hypothetical protein
MIQVCSQCGTRWNVRDRERAWCPRCHGTLLAPAAPQLPPGYRWIAMRPGAAPPPRTRGRPLGPTPRYPYIPRWGLVDRIGPTADQEDAPRRRGPSRGAGRATLVTAMVVLGLAGLVHAVRYGLLIVNRDMLLNGPIAGAATWSGIGVSIAAIVAVVASAVMLTRWLIARRASAYEHRGQGEPRSLWALRAGCLVPLVNLLWAPVYVIELARIEERYPRLRRPIRVWWIVWVASTAVSIFSIATSFTSDAQGIADNTVATTIAYLVALAAAAATLRVFLGFERNPVERPAHRWVVAGGEEPPTGQSEDETEAESVGPVESEGREPAA